MISIQVNKVNQSKQLKGFFQREMKRNWKGPQENEYEQAGLEFIQQKATFEEYPPLGFPEADWLDMC